MNMPGFTAEASLDNSQSLHDRHSVPVTSLTQEALSPSSLRVFPRGQQ
jgi:hypothetical protein